MENTRCPICNGNKSSKRKYCSYRCRNIYINSRKDYKKQNENVKKGILIYIEKTRGKFKEFTVSCSRCDKKFIIKERKFLFPKKDRYYCSDFCAHARPQTEKTKEKIREKLSIAIKKKWKNGDYDNVDFNFNSNNKRFSSIAEREIVKYFKTNFEEEEWKSGGTLKQNEVRLARDLYSNKLKVCIEYDGIWHFKDIHGQLKDKQEKDRMLKLWCEINEYKLIRVRDHVYLKDKEKVLKQIIKHIHESDKKLVKIY